MNRDQTNLEEIKNLCGEKKIIIFGAGFWGSILYKKVCRDYDIAYVVDNNIENGYTFYGNKIVNFKFLLENYMDEMIVVTSLDYCDEISEQLEKYHFEYKKNFVIWNGLFDVTSKPIDFADDNTKRFIEKNIELWSKSKRSNKKAKVIIPYRNTVEISYAPWSYAANYLSDKYDAEILCAGGVESPFDDNLLKLYESFNVSGVIDERPTAEIKKEADNIFERLWGHIKCKQDILDIEVYGESYGKDILRDYLRFDFPIVYMTDINLKRQIKRMIEYIVFWNKYINENHENIKAIVLWDGIYYREGIIRKLAVSYDIPTYTIVNTTAFRWEYEEQFDFEFYKKFYYMLSNEEKKEGIEWAKRKLKEHFEGTVRDEEMVRKSVFQSYETHKLLDESKKIKIMICPHYSQDDAFSCGDMLFTDPWDWLEHLGKISEETEYDWYLKPHPIEKELGDKLIEDYLKKYTKIKLLPKYVSPFQLKEEGISYALTIHGSIGYEYPMLGINVINAGNNPHIAFDFDINPKTIEEYDEVIFNLEKVNKKIDINEIYMFYLIHFGYYERRRIPISKLYFKDERLRDIRGLIGSKTESTTELFKYYVDEIDEKRHIELQGVTQRLFDKMDHYKDGVFYKKELE